MATSSDDEHMPTGPPATGESLLAQEFVALADPIGPSSGSGGEGSGYEDLLESINPAEVEFQAIASHLNLSHRACDVLISWHNRNPDPVLLVLSQRQSISSVPTEMTH